MVEVAWNGEWDQRTGREGEEGEGAHERVWEKFSNAWDCGGEGIIVRAVGRARGMRVAEG